tara:strand:+ start:90 stop:236 length:147 start_codon:yes stop_codon:yes gene_type:complete
MSYTTSYIIDLSNLALELDFLLSDELPFYDDNRIMELESEIQQMKDTF